MIFSCYYEICNFTDNKTWNDFPNILMNLKHDNNMKTILKWFKINSLQTNPRKLN